MGSIDEEGNETDLIAALYYRTKTYIREASSLKNLNSEPNSFPNSNLLDESDLT